MLWKVSLWAFGRNNSLLLRSVPEKNNLHYGVGNRCHDGLYVLFLDYDRTPLEWVRDEVALLQKMYRKDLGTAYIFKTKRGFHVLFLEKHPLGRIVEMMSATSCDPQYKAVPLQYGRKVWVLRQSEKKGERIAFVGACPVPKCPVMRSRAHAIYLMSFAGLTEEDMGAGRWDDGRFLTMAYYKIADENN